MDPLAETYLAHYVELFQQPGWAPYVKQRVEEMATEHPTVFGDLPARMRAALPTAKTKESN